MTQLRDDLITVEVPSMAFGLMVNNYGNESELMYMLSMEDIADDDNTEETLITKKLPAGSWQFICTTKDITEKQAKGIVGSSEWYFPERHIRYIDYNHLVGPDGKQAWNIGFSNALLSLRSLLASKGLDVSKNYALLKKG